MLLWENLSLSLQNLLLHCVLSDFDSLLWFFKGFSFWKPLTLTRFHCFPVPIEELSKISISNCLLPLSWCSFIAHYSPEFPYWKANFQHINSIARNNIVLLNSYRSHGGSFLNFFWSWMIFSTLVGVTPKFLMPFSKICKWFLVKMSSNHKHSCLNGNVCSSYNRKEAKESLHKRANDWKWIRVLVLLCLMVSCTFIWVLISSNHGKLGRAVESLLLIEEASQDSLEKCNASTEKVSVALAY